MKARKMLFVLLGIFCTKKRIGVEIPHRQLAGRDDKIEMFLHENDMVKEKESNNSDIGRGLYQDSSANSKVQITLSDAGFLEKLMNEKEKMVNEKEKKIYERLQFIDQKIDKNEKNLEEKIGKNKETLDEFIKDFKDVESKKEERTFSLGTLIITNGITILIALVGWFLKK